MVNQIYPPELQLNKANISDTEAPFLDLHLSVANGFVSSKIYDKRDDFDFDIVNFPFLDGDVPRRASYGVYISQLIRFARVCNHVTDFNARNKCLTAKRSLDTEANRFYDRNHQMYDAALLTRCYTQHALRPFIDSESNHIRSFIKIPFINKGIDFIDLPSIFQDKSVIQSIPTYFQNSEPPIICYKYNKPIRNTIFNFNKLVSDLDIHANTPKS